jgi:hypothetical protein
MKAVKRILSGPVFQDLIFGGIIPDGLKGSIHLFQVFGVYRGIVVRG